MKSGRISNWYFEHIGPLIDAYWAGEMATAREAYESALRSLAGEPDVDLRQAKWMRLANAWLFILMESGSQEEGQTVLQELEASWSDATLGAEASEMARVTELLTLVHLDLGGWRKLPADEALRLIEAVPNRVRGANFWNEVGMWSFLHGEADLVELSAAHFASEPPVHLEAWYYHRTMLMYRLMKHIADQGDFEQVVALIESKPQLREVERFILPECRRQGIATQRGEVTLLAKSSLYAA